ncbi:heterokaryon incompatibility protein-domain-containing protein [Phaeosphaeriaceae sp. PMI808]|nr:heterokaryon incompatibility protein-domain-containing protein [Phaeosphaeriaceae sp. PMI808]
MGPTRLQSITGAGELKSLNQIAQAVFDKISNEKTKNTPLQQAPSQELYTPLNEGEIRILSISPSKDQHSSLSCTLHPVSLRLRPQYTALSYVWGDPSNPEQAEVNGHTVLLQSNLAVALRQIRATKTPEICRAIWADALCINQLDNKEKAEQVRMMDRIYPWATLVIAWFGPSYVGSTAALRAVTRSVALASRVPTVAQKIKVLAEEFNWDLYEDGLPKRFPAFPNSGPWNALRELHDNTY